MMIKKLVGFCGGTVVGNPPASAGDMDSSPGLEGSHVLQSNWARAPQLLSPVPQLLKPVRLEPVLCNKRSHSNKPAHHSEERLPLAATREKPACSNEDPMQPKINKIK